MKGCRKDTGKSSLVEVFFGQYKAIRWSWVSPSDGVLLAIALFDEERNRVLGTIESQCISLGQREQNEVLSWSVVKIRFDVKYDSILPRGR